MESNCLSREKQTVFSYMGPLAVLERLALRHRNTLTETMNTRRTATATEVISMSWPSLVPYQGASTVGRNERDISWDVHHAASGQLLCLWNKRSIGIKLGNLCCTLNIRINICMLLWTGAANKAQSGNDIFEPLITVCNILQHQGLMCVCPNWPNYDLDSWQPTHTTLKQQWWRATLAFRGGWTIYPAAWNDKGCSYSTCFPETLWSALTADSPSAVLKIPL